MSEDNTCTACLGKSEDEGPWKCGRCGREIEDPKDKYISQLKEAMQTVISAVGNFHQDVDVNWIVFTLRRAILEEVPETTRAEWMERILSMDTKLKELESGERRPTLDEAAAYAERHAIIAHDMANDKGADAYDVMIKYLKTARFSLVPKGKNVQTRKTKNPKESTKNHP